jgi:hypothetical protein
MTIFVTTKRIVSGLLFVLRNKIRNLGLIVPFWEDSPAKRRRALGLSLGVLIAAVGVCLYFARPEPQLVYQGKRLSEWLRLYQKRWAKQKGDSDETLQAAEAVRKIGTNALPQLIAWMRYDSPSLSKTLSAFADKLPTVFHANARIAALVPNATGRHQLARTGFGLLGPAASPALSELLITLTNSSAPFREEASDAIGNLGSSARPAIPALLACLQETNEVIAVAAAGTLGRLRLEPDVVVPALLQGLGSPMLNTRVSAGNALIRFGPEARSALPTLLTLLNSPAPDVRGIAEGAILAIAPDEMPKERSNDMEAAMEAFRKRYGLTRRTTKSPANNDP